MLPSLTPYPAAHLSTIAEPPMPRTGSVKPVLPNSRVGISEAASFAVVPASAGSSDGSAAAPAAASKEERRNSRGAHGCLSRVAWEFSC